MIAALDHLVLTTRFLDKCVDFYTRVLEMQVQSFGNGRLALLFGNQKINLHEYGHEFEPKSEKSVPGSLDLCFLVNRPLAQVIEALNAHGIPIIEGPVVRTGACFQIMSVYIRDPDGNLVELSARIGDKL